MSSWPAGRFLKVLRDVFKRLGQVVAGGGCRPFRVPGLAGSEDLGVLTIEPVRGDTLGCVDLQVRAGDPSEVVDEVYQARSARELVQAHVEPVVQLDVLVRIGA